MDDLDLLLSLLSSTAAFLDVKGMHASRIPVLKMITRVRQWRTPFDDGPLVADLATLGLQYLRLGYSGRAGLVLANAQMYREKSMMPSHVLLRLHLTYAEYHLAIGNADAW